MKRLITALVLSTTLGSSFIVPASGAVKAGASCTKLKATTTVSGYKYTCIKSGNRLVWSKGVKVQIELKPSISPTAKAEALKSQIDLEKVNLKNEMIYRLNNGVLERQALNKLYFKSDSRPLTDFDPVRVAAYSAIIEHKSSLDHPNFAIEYQISQSFPQVLVDYSVNQIEKTVKYWNSVLDRPTSFVVKLITEKDRKSVLKDPLMFSGMDQALDRLASWDSNSQPIFFTGGGGYLLDNSDSRFKGLLMIATSSYAVPEKMNFEWPATVSHEITHIVQGFFFKDKLPTITPNQYQAISPDNFREGTANLFGYATSLNLLGWYSDELDKNLYNCINSVGKWARVEKEEDVVKLLTATEIRTPEEAHTMSYPMGALLYEWILYKYGYDKVLEVIKGQGSSIDYSENIRNSLGITKDSLYKESAPYIFSTIKRVLAN